MIDRASALELLASRNPERHLVCHALETLSLIHISEPTRRS
jgi:chromosome segregation and condensation protein ScpB